MKSFNTIFKNGHFYDQAKAESNMHDADVIQKMNAAINYCRHATALSSQNHDKPWHYLVVPHIAVSRTLTLSFLIAQYCK